MAAQARRGQGPPSAQAARERARHSEQLRGHRFLAGRGPRPSVTVVPAPLRFWQFDPPVRSAVLFTIAVVAIWLGVFGWLDGAAGMRAEAPLALGLGLAVLAANVGRLTVSDHAVSTDALATRTPPSRIVPLVLIREVRLGVPPADWPTPSHRGGWLPGRTRVAVRHLADDGLSERTVTHWVRDPQAFADALGHPLEAPSRG